MFLTEPAGASKQSQGRRERPKEPEHFEIINSSVYLDPSDIHDDSARKSPLRGQTRAQDKRRPAAERQRVEQEEAGEGMRMEAQDDEPAPRDQMEQKQKNRVTFKKTKEKDESTLFLTAMGDQADEDEGESQSPLKD